MNEISREPFRLWETQQIRWGDMDAFGHVNNARYFTYCESARMRYFAELRMDELCGTTNHGPAVVSATCNFRQQVHYPDTLEVGVRTTRIGKTSFTLEYAMFRNGSDDLVADGTSIAVWVDYDRGRSIAVPDLLRQRIRAFERLDL